MSEAKKSEPVRGAAMFLKWIAELGDGVTARDLGNDLANLFRELNEQAIDQGVVVKGDLAVRFKMKAEKTGLVTVSVESKITQPKRPTAGGVGWLTPRGEFTTTNPKQLELGKLREVVGGKRPAAEVVDEDDESGFAR